VFHKGRWGKGQAANSRDNGFAVRNQNFRLVGRNALYDMEKDPSQKTNVIEDHPDIAKKMNSVYDKWFDGALPNMVNEDAPLTGHNTFHLMYWKQYGIEIPPVKQRKPKPPKKKRPKRN
jgi:arylsulfatase